MLKSIFLFFLPKSMSVFFALSLLFFSLIALGGCEKHKDPNAPFYKYLSLQQNQKPLHFEKRRINLDKSFALEILLVFKVAKDSDWYLMILKKKPAQEEYFVHSKIKVADKDDILDRVLIKDLFLDAYNSVGLEFSRVPELTKQTDHQTDKNNTSPKYKKITVFRYPDTSAIWSQKFAVTNQRKKILTQQAKASSSAKEKSSDNDLFFQWQDTNGDGHYELLVPSNTESDDKQQYAYSAAQGLKNFDIYKFNGVEFVNFDPAKPFFYFRQLKMPAKVQAGKKYDIDIKITNLGGYTAKSYFSISAEPAALFTMQSLKQFGRIYRPGSSVFHYRKNGHIRSSYPLVEYTVFPWPKKRTYTFRLTMKIPEKTKAKQIVLKHRAAVEFRGRSTYLPDASHKSSKIQTDQQGFPAYFHVLPLIVLP